MTLTYFAICLSTFLMSACHPKSRDAAEKLPDALQIVDKASRADSLGVQKKVASVPSPRDQGEAWLSKIFKTNNSDKYFPDYNVEERLCTKRFQSFIAESGELYGPSNLSDEEFAAAERAFKVKWSEIYPLEEREMWLFGRGNGDVGELKTLAISKISDGVYTVFIDYGNNIKTQSEVLLVTENGDYKIDYSQTVFL